MKLFALIFFLTSISPLFAQDYNIETIKYKPDNFKFDYNPFNYPLFKFDSLTYSNEINSAIKKITLDYWLDDSDSSFHDILTEIKYLNNRDLTSSHQLTGFSYEIIFNKGDLLSIETTAEICDRAIWHISNQFAIDIKQKKILNIGDIVNDGQLDSLKQILLKHKKDWSKYAIKEIQDSIINEKDEELIAKYKWGIDEIKGCLTDYYNNIKKFKISNNDIYFDYGCELLDEIWNVCPISDHSTKINQKVEYKGIIRDKYFNLIYGN
jgi:hypothetical protein